MYAQRRTGIVLGFHGGEKAELMKLVNGPKAFKPSENSYDWLGHGVYFWENSPGRALQFAQAKKGIKEPSVIGAVIDLWHCLDLLEQDNLSKLKQTAQIYIELKQVLNESIPENKSPGGSFDMLLRHLDCAVIEYCHKINESEGQRPYDTVRGVFWEGEELYANAGFREMNHIQLCVRNPNSILGLFLPREADTGWLLP